jgi:two-component system NtrC family sensor kinase
MAVAKYLQSPSKLLIAAAVLVPTLLFCVTASFDYHATQSRAEEYVITTTNALAEQMQAALQTANMILARTLDYVAGMDWQTIGTSRDVHEYLAKIDRDLLFVQSVFLVDPDGRNSASSRAFPMQPFDVRDREYYISAKAGDLTPHITPTFSGKMTGEPGFTVSLPRLTNGRFDGVVAVTLSPSYFQRFYEQIAPPVKNASAALVRIDGKLLMRYPGADSGPGEVPRSSPLLQAAASGAASGIFVGKSSIDGITKLAAFRKVEGQPLLANFALAQSYYLRAWHIDLIWMCGFALLTAAALIWASMLVLSRAGTETAQLRQLLDEGERRKAAEQAVQHLQKMEALGRLSGGVAHDFNNQLTAIIGALELAANHANEPQRLMRLVNMAMSAAERGARLTSQMLAFSRNHDITPQPLDINTIIKDADALLQRTVESLIEISYTRGESVARDCGSNAVRGRSS